MHYLLIMDHYASAIPIRIAASCEERDGAIWWS